MKSRQEAFVATFVATRRTERALERAEADWQRWLDRVGLARRLNRSDLADLARIRALRSAETTIALRRSLAEQRRLLHRLEQRVGCSR